MSGPIIAEGLAAAVSHGRASALPSGVRETCERLLIDIAGLCVAARNADYVRAALDSWEAQGGSTAIGHERTLDAAGAAFVNGTAAHGEDFDDTFEGGPVHAGVVIVPALLAAAERHRISGADLLYGIAVGCEVMCRGSLVAPGRIHKAGFHPTAVLGALGAAAGVAAALRLDAATFASAQGIAGSMASGIIEYLAEGTWTKRMHPGWAAQSGLRAVELARLGFAGPRTVWEGAHGFLHGFANTTEGAWDKLLDDFGTRWVTPTIAFKPYACGTMIHPFIDCARRIALTLTLSLKGEGTEHRVRDSVSMKEAGEELRAKGSLCLQGEETEHRVRDSVSMKEAGEELRAKGALSLQGEGRGEGNITSITCDTAEGYVHRLWEPFDAKRRPPNPYAAKFSIPWCIGYAMVHGAVGLEAFTEAHLNDPRIVEIAGKVSYRVNPDDPYPNEYTGHVRVVLADGHTLEERQPHLRGGHHEPLTRAEIEEKFHANCAYGGWRRERATQWLRFARGAFAAATLDLSPFRG